MKRPTEAIEHLQYMVSCSLVEDERAMDAILAYITALESSLAASESGRRDLATKAFWAGIRSKEKHFTMVEKVAFASAFVNQDLSSYLKSEGFSAGLGEKGGVHGETCPKVPHTNPAGGYLHAADDDRPYDVDGCKYCGRCHRAL